MLTKNTAEDGTIEQKETEGIKEMKNPFTPNFGKEPAVLAGRREIMEELDQAFRNAPDGTAVNYIFTGVSGIGKTVMLTHYDRKMSGEGWIVVNVSCTKGMLDDIYQQTLKNAGHLLKNSCRSSEKAVGLKNSIEDPCGANNLKVDTKETDWQIRMTDIISVLNAHGTGLLITVDELNPGQKEMTLFSNACQMWVREKRKVAFLMAGIPGNVSTLLNKESSPFLRDCRQYVLTVISDEEIGKAFEETVKRGGKKIEPPALQKAVEAIGGYPYMLQLVGYRAFFYSKDRDTITEDDVMRGIKAAEENLKTNALKLLLDRLSDMDIRFLEVMAQDGKNLIIAEIADGLGRTKSFAHRYKNRLLKQGIIRITEEGCAAFALPGLVEYVKEYCRQKNGIEE